MVGKRLELHELRLSLSDTSMDGHSHTISLEEFGDSLTISLEDELWEHYEDDDGACVVRLLCAAPELLEACTSAVNGFQNLCSYINEHCELKLKDGTPMRLKVPFGIVGELKAAIDKATKGVRP